MATITTDRYLDAAACTAGEAWVINNGAKLTIRTDTRVHANAPASMTGTLGAQTVNEGEIFIDAQNVRWLAYNSGSGNVPTIGTTISQGAVNGYLLGVWGAINTANTSVGTAMPTTGFIKFREVTGGPFSSGALTGIGASATGADVAGWLEIVADQSTDITVPRLGKYTTRGQRFYLDNTNGSLGQVFQIPTNGGGAATHGNGAFIETTPGSEEYEFWTCLNAAGTNANGWRYQDLGAPRGATDKRQQFLKSLGSGQMQMSENVDVTGTYASTATIAATYAGITISNNLYIRSGGEVLIYVSGGHGLIDDQIVYLDFTSGGATAQDGMYVITFIDAVFFSVSLAGTDTAGLVTIRPGVAVTFTAHGLCVGDNVYLDFTTGTGVDGLYPIISVAANTFNVAYPHSAALTSGNVTVYWGTTITTSVAHNLAIGNLIKCDFTSGTGVGGTWPICAVPTTTTLTINYPFFGLTGGNVTMQFQIGHVAPSGCKVWIPNILLRQCATGTRATNAIAHATIASRPEFITTAAGTIDMEYVDGDWRVNFGQPFSCRLHNVVIADQIYIAECATAVDADTIGIGSPAALAIHKFDVNTCFAGGILNNVTAMYAALPTANIHAMNLANCSGGFIVNKPILGNSVQFARNASSYGLYINSSVDVDIINMRLISGRALAFGSSSNITFTNTDYCDRFIGYSNAVVNGYGAITTSQLGTNIKIDGVTYGLNGTIPNVQSFAGGCVDIASKDTIVRNIGTKANPINCGTWRPNAYAQGYPVYVAGIAAGCKFQRIFTTKTRAPFLFSNANKNITFETVISPPIIANNTNHTPAFTPLDSVFKSCGYGNITVTGQSSVYGVHFVDNFTSNRFGRYDLLMNEPTVKTSSQYSVQSGTPKFNSAGGVLMYPIGTQATWEDTDFRKGHTGFAWQIPIMDGGTAIRYYDIHYQIDTGSGFSAWKNYVVAKGSAAGTIGQYTMNIANTTGIEIGDSVVVTGITSLLTGIYAKVTQINSPTQITVDVPHIATFSAVFAYFTHLPSEIVDPSVGFKLRIRITTTAVAAAAITMLRTWTTTSSAAQEYAIYPLDVTPFTFSVEDTTSSPVTGYEFRIYLKDPTAGIIGTDLDGYELYNSASYTFNHEYSSDTDVVVQIMKEGYEESTTEYTINATSQSVKIIMQTEYNI